MVLQRFVFFVVSELPSLLGKDSAVVSHCFLYNSEFKAFLHLDWLPSKAREPTIFFYLIHSLKREEMDL